MLCLAHSTSARWVETALAHVDAVLVDHAHCEMKAASNALSLAVRAGAYPGVVAALLSLAEEELAHFRRVYGELERRNIPLGTPPVDNYAAELRKRVRATPAARACVDTQRDHGALIDRLLVAALIEARSCERFRLLSEALKACGPADLQTLYEELLAAEARHFRIFVDLAHLVARPDDDWIEHRLDQVAAVEAELSSELAHLPSIHG